MSERSVMEARMIGVLESAVGWLPEEQLADMASLVDAGESIIAFENFCAQVYEYDVVVPEATLNELREIAAMMNVPFPAYLERSGHA